MALNKFMHPRNKYRKPPNFKELAIKYPEFRKYAKQDISGKVCLDFKNVEAMRALTKTLLKEDFNLDVEIPLNRLIPTLPLRLNYLLWIEDILKCNPTTETVKGIDIGCGASCVYPLLAAKQFNWHMLATEVDSESAFTASNNVRRNNLNDMISVRTVKEGIILEGVLNPDIVYDFCMCNPPFFSSEDELEPQNKARSLSRSLPRNAHSGSLSELVAPGGETAFVGKIIQDSVKLKGLIRVYSVMVGHKTSVSKVKHALQEAGVTRVAETEFCQGRTTRWGVAWTLDTDVILPQPKDVPLTNKKKTPFTLPSELTFNETVPKLHQLMAQLQITYSTLKDNPELNAMEITAMTNTWSNLRRKRRQEKLKQITDKDDKDITSVEAVEENSKDKCKVIEKDQTMSNYGGEGRDRLGTLQGDSKAKKENNVNDDKESKIRESSETSQDVNKRPRSESSGDTNAPKKLKFEDNNQESVSSKREPFLSGSLMVKNTGSGAVVELFWLRGPGGRDAAHQVLQYFKNNLKTN